MLENIVKLNAPFTGGYIYTSDPKMRVVIPSELRRTLKLRQKKGKIKDCILYYAVDSINDVIFLTDMPPKEGSPQYYLINIDSQGRITIPVEYFHTLPPNEEALIVGHGNYIELRQKPKQPDNNPQE